MAFDTVNHQIINTPPTELAESFRPGENVTFELVKRAETTQLWRSTEILQLDDESQLQVTKFHVTDRDELTCSFMRDFDAALSVFDYVQKSS